MPPVPVPDLLCLSHLRWDFVFQRPNHLMTRAARDRRVFFVEEPVLGEGGLRLETLRHAGVTVVRPHLPAVLPGADRDAALEGLLQEFAGRERIARPWLWYYTPMALPWTRSLQGSAVIYDCMDDLSAFRGAPAQLVQLERELLASADVVFTGGRSLYEAKASLHPNIHPIPSSVDTSHFARARRAGPDPEDQARIAHPRIGYYGVIDERLDRELLVQVARLRPDWQLVLVGPVAKLALDEVPTAPNIHHLGMKGYDELPDYLRGWDVAIMPFARNEATRFISPTKTPEYLAGGRPVVSTPIRDVVEPYGRLGLVHVAESPVEFVAAVEAALREDVPALLARADGLLAEMSWDASWARMDGLVRSALRGRDRVAQPVSLPAMSRPSRVPVTSGTSAAWASNGARPAVTTRRADRAARADDELAGVR